MTDTTSSTSSAFWAATHGSGSPLPIADLTPASGGCGCGPSPAATEKSREPAASSCCGSDAKKTSGQER